MESQQINLNFHERPISHIIFNGNYDLLFTASLDEKIGLWNIQGEFLGSYEEHEGAVWCLDEHNNKIASGSGDLSLMVWDLKGKSTHKFEEQSIIKDVKFYDDKNIFYLRDDSMGGRPSSFLINLDDKSKIEFEVENVPTGLLYFKNNLVIANNCGELCLFDLRTNNLLKKVKAHEGRINRIVQSFCKTFFISSSIDGTAKIIDFELNIIKTIQCGDPINTATVSKDNSYVVLAGGISARDIALTKGRAKFDVNFFDAVTEKYVGAFSPHFGPVNSIALHENNRIFASGGEDGYVCLIDSGEQLKNKFIL